VEGTNSPLRWRVRGYRSTTRGSPGRGAGLRRDGTPSADTSAKRSPAWRARHRHIPFAKARPPSGASPPPVAIALVWVGRLRTRAFVWRCDRERRSWWRSPPSKGEVPTESTRAVRAIVDEIGPFRAHDCRRSSPTIAIGASPAAKLRTWRHRVVADAIAPMAEDIVRSTGGRRRAWLIRGLSNRTPQRPIPWVATQLRRLWMFSPPDEHPYPREGEPPPEHMIFQSGLGASQRIGKSWRCRNVPAPGPVSRPTSALLMACPPMAR
jgi:hypothetical protein